MKLLRNPMFTAGLVIVALATVFYQLVIPRLRTGRSFALPPVQGASAPVLSTSPGVVAQARPSPRAAGPRTVPSATIDREYVEVHFDAWVNYPVRDPFWLATPDPEETPANTETNSPVPTWKLRAILALTGSRMAVINRGWYHEGDEIDGYRIDRIETGGVWFIGPREHEKERLGFDTRPKPPATNSPPVPTPQPVPTNLIKP